MNNLKIDRAKLLGIGLVLPVVSWISIVLLYPLVRTIYFSFFKYFPGRGLAFVGFSNYVDLLTTPLTYQAFKITAIWVIVVVPMQYLLALLTAIALHENVKGTNVYKIFVLIPWVMPPVASALVWKWLFDPIFGLVNQTFLELGLISTKVSWLGSLEFALPTIMFIQIWAGFSFAALTFFAQLHTIPPDLYESAKMDGANAFRRFRHITMPQLGFVSRILLIFLFFWAFGSYVYVYALTKGGPLYSTHLISYHVYYLGFQRLELELAYALSIIMLLVSSIVAAAFILQIRKKGGL